MPTIAGVEIPTIDLAPILDKTWQEDVINRITADIMKTKELAAVEEAVRVEAVRSMWLCVKWAHAVSGLIFNEPEPESRSDVTYRQQLQANQHAIQAPSWYVAYAEGRGRFMVDPVRYTQYVACPEQISKVTARPIVVELAVRMGWTDLQDANTNDAKQEMVTISVPSSQLQSGTDYLYDMSQVLHVSNEILTFLQNRLIHNHCPVANLFTVGYRAAGKRLPVLISKHKDMDYLSSTETGAISYFPMDRSSSDRWASARRLEIKVGRFIRTFFDKEWLDHFNITDKDIETFVNAYTAEFSFTDDIREVEGKAIKYWYHEDNYDRSKRVLNNSCMRYAKVQDRMSFYVDNPDTIHMLITVNFEEKLTGRALIWIDPDGKKWLDRIYADDKTAAAMKRYREQQGWGDVRNDAKKVRVTPKSPWYASYPYVDTMNRITVDGSIYNQYGDPGGSINIYSYQSETVLRPVTCKACDKMGFAMHWRGKVGTNTDGYCDKCYYTERNKAAQAVLDKAVKQGYISRDNLSMLADRRLMTSSRMFSTTVYVGQSNGVQVEFISRLDQSWWDLLTPERKAREEKAHARRAGHWEDIRRGRPLAEGVTWAEVEDLKRAGYIERVQAGQYGYRAGDDSLFWNIYVKGADDEAVLTEMYHGRSGGWITRAAHEEAMKKKADALKAKLERPHEPWVRELNEQAGAITFSWQDDGRTSFAKRERD